jgi:hypothetical protein
MGGHHERRQCECNKHEKYRGLKQCLGCSRHEGGVSVANCPTSKDYHLTTVLCEANQRCASDRCSSSVFPEDRTVMHSRREQQPQRTRRSTVYREKRRDRHTQSQLHLNATSIEEGKAGWPSTSQRSCGERRDQETLTTPISTPSQRN